MTVFPLILDARPEYLRGSECLSLLQLPLGAETLLEYFGRRLRTVTNRRPAVIRTFEAGPGYDAALVNSGAVGGASIPATAFASHLAGYEPSDWLLVVDPRCFAVAGFDPSVLLEDVGQGPAMARHLVAFDHGTAGTNERVEFDAGGLVCRVRRYYDAVTWNVTSGVACSLVPVSALIMAKPAAIESVADLRCLLASAGVPSRDVAVTGPCMDLSREHALLAIQERASGEIARDAVVHRSARLAGAVTIHAGARVAEDAVVVGPTVIGAGAHVERGAVLAQCVVAPGVRVAAGAVHRHRLVTDVMASANVSTTMDDLLQDVQLSDQLDPRQLGLYPVVKTALESLIAIIALVMLSPVLLIVAAVVRLDSKGPIFYGDPREAKGGRLFPCFKFRTMLVGADAVQRDLMAVNQVDGPQFKMEHDPRVTRVGRWLRALSLDELPQLYNVAMGHMSLVGPRPSPFRENQTCVPWRDARLSVRPGITGLWQVCRHERQLGDFHQWIYYDIQYVRHMSFWVDLKIILATIFTLGGKGHVPLSWVLPSAKEHA